MLALKRPPLFPSRQPRAAVEFSAHLLLANDRVVPIAVKNVSERGFMGLCPVPLKEGTWLGLEVAGYAIVRAVVRWSEDGEFGCSFRSPVDLERLNRAVSAPSAANGLFRRLPSTLRHDGAAGAFASCRS